MLLLVAGSFAPVFILGAIITLAFGWSAALIMGGGLLILAAMVAYLGPRD